MRPGDPLDVQDDEALKAKLPSTPTPVLEGVQIRFDAPYNPRAEWSDEEAIIGIAAAAFLGTLIGVAVAWRRR